MDEINDDMLLQNDIKLLPSSLNSDNLVSVLTEFFNNINFNISIKNLNIYINSKENESCGIITINNDHIYLNIINKCNITGTDFLVKLETFAKKYNFKYIQLMDDSNIIIENIKIPLSILKILTKGESWYNSKGYYYTNYIN